MTKFTALFFFLVVSLVANEKVVLQLKWLHQFQFAGYYAALEKGFYDEVGLDVEIRQRDLRYNNIRQVIEGEADYGVADSVLLLYKAKKEPVVMVAPIFQHSPNVLLSLKSSNLDSPYKLENKKLLFYKTDTDGFGILGMFQSLGIKPEIYKMKGAMDYKLLANKQMDLFVGYLTNEPFYFKQMGIELNIINPAHYGFDLYGDMLFTSTQEATNNPQRVERFKKATIKGWQYAMEHKDEIIAIIKNKYATDKSVEHLKYEANALDDMIQYKAVPIGTIDKGRIEYTLSIYEKYGLIERNTSIEDYIFEPRVDKELGLNTHFLSDEETEYLKQKRVIRICIDPDRMPFEKNEHGKHIGMSADYIALLQKNISITTQLVNTKSWKESLEYIKQKKCDILSLAMPTKERLEYMNFTKPYIVTPLVIVTNLDELFVSDITKVVDKKIGLIQGCAYGEILREKYPLMQFVYVENIKDGLDKVNDGELFGFIEALSTVGYQIQNNYTGQLKIAGKFNENLELGIGVRNDEPILRDILDKAIGGISSSQKYEILDKWISVNYDNNLNYALFLKWIGVIAFIFTAILSVVVFVNRKLSSEIESRKKIEQKLKKHIDLVDENIIISTTDLDGKIIDVSTAFSKISGYTKEELIGKTHSFSKAMDENVYKELWDTIVQDHTYHGELKNRAKDGTFYWVNVSISPVFDENGQKIAYTAIRQDITSRKKLEDLSITDDLTSIYNRRYFNEIFPKLINSAKREDENISFAMMDIDNFKLYNDNYGHLAGDEVLKKIAKSLGDSLQRLDDYCFRLGGEEFGILFKGLDQKEAKALIETIRKNIENLNIEHKKNSASKYVTASFGLVFYDAKSINNTDELYKEADDLLYMAKETGRNRVVANI